MTGLDCLREELKKRGLPTQSVYSKPVAAVLDIVARSGNKYTEMWKSEKEASKLEEKLRDQIRWEEKHYTELTVKIEEARKELAQYEIKKQEIKDYLDKLIDSINNCETPEGRDAMRTAQMFVNTAEVNTKYDNTAFIIGLAAILSKGGINAIDELQKINSKLPRLSRF